MQYTLEELRERISLIDKAILNMVLQRMALIPLVAEVKKRDSLPIHQPVREKLIFENLESFSKENGVKEEVIKNIFNSLINYSKEIEEYCIKQRDTDYYDVFKLEEDSNELTELYNGTFSRLIEYNSLMECLKNWHLDAKKYGDFGDFMTLLTHGEINKKYL
jgi:chorismate mutase